MNQQWNMVSRFIGSMVVIGPMVFHANNAAAHVFPRKESPAAGATVEAPAEVSIRFDGPLEPSFSTLTVSDSSGKRVSTGDAKVDPQQPTDLSVKLPSLAPGHYTVQWAAVASDGHRTHGDYPFDVK